jgi:hypothetical protein
VTAQAQSELKSADVHYTELREQARVLNTNLAESEFKQKSAEDEVHKLRRILKEAEERIKDSSTKIVTASRDRDDGVLQLYAEKARANEFEEAAQRAVNAELVQHSYLKRV